MKHTVSLTNNNDGAGYLHILKYSFSLMFTGDASKYFLSTSLSVMNLLAKGRAIYLEIEKQANRSPFNQFKTNLYSLTSQIHSELYTIKEPLTVVRPSNART